MTRRTCALASLLLIAACSVTLEGYRASSLTSYLPERPVRIDHSGATTTIGHITRERDLERLLGRRSRRLLAGAHVVQVRIVAGAKPVELPAGWLTLLEPGGEELAPLAPGRVLTAVSLPEGTRIHAGISKTVEQRVKESAGVEPQPANPDPVLLAVALLTSTTLDQHIREAYAEAYRDQARADVLAKTTAPARIEAGREANLLAVFVPTSGKRAGSRPLELVLRLLGDDGVAQKRVTLAAE